MEGPKSRGFAHGMRPTALARSFTDKKDARLTVMNPARYIVNYEYKISATGPTMC